MTVARGRMRQECCRVGGRGEGASRGVGVTWVIPRWGSSWRGTQGKGARGAGGAPPRRHDGGWECGNPARAPVHTRARAHTRGHTHTHPSPASPKGFECAGASGRLREGRGERGLLASSRGEALAPPSFFGSVQRGFDRWKRKRRPHCIGWLRITSYIWPSRRLPLCRGVSQVLALCTLQAWDWV